MTIQGDGYQTFIDFDEDLLSSGLVVLTDEMAEKEITPPGVAGGGANDASTMRNELWRTMSPKSLRTLTPCTAVVAYDPELYREMEAMININQLITITFPDGSTLKFWGWIDDFSPGASVEGSQPTATITIIPSNQDGDNNNAEIAPVYTR